MTTITLQVPDSLEKEYDETVRFLAAKLYEAGKLSLGQAAEMCGMKKWDFPEVLAKFNVPYFQYTYEDVMADVSQGSVNSYAVITDTSCFILLDKIGALKVLHTIYEHVLTTPEIALEFKKPLPEWIQVIPVKALHLMKAYAEQVDLGEASAIALAQETPNALLIVDDFKGRKLAKQLKIKFTGTIGVLITARQQNLISSLRTYFDLIKSTDFRIDPDLLDHILSDFGD